MTRVKNFVRNWLITILIWLIFSFVTSEPDPSGWNELTRAIFVIVVFASMFLKELNNEEE
jgi:hypothetical protein